MMKLLIISTAIFLFNFFASSRSLYFSEIESEIDKTVICVTQYLVKMEKLEKDFVKFSTVDRVECDRVIPVTIDELTRVLIKKFEKCKSIKYGCVLRNLKNRGAIDYIFLMEILRMQTLETEKSKKFEDSVIRKLKIILEEISEDCESDETYGGIFDEYLDCKNNSFSFLQENFCLTKFSLDYKFIQVEKVGDAGMKISSSDDKCKTLVAKFRLRSEKNFLKNIRKQEFEEKQVKCLMERYRNELGFRVQLAKEVLRNLNISDELTRKNQNKINEKEISIFNYIMECL